MRKQLLFFLSLFLSTQIVAQPYNNEWIDFEQPHFKILVDNEGIHRVPNSLIVQKGLNFIDPENFKVFRDGQEIPIYVHTNNNVVDYIEFYAYPNDGKLDTRLFRQNDHQLHDRFSLFTDEAAYFLTWNDVGNNLRIEDQTNNLSNLPPKENYFYHTESLVFTNYFNKGAPYYIQNTPLYTSLFDDGEGFISNSQFNNSNTQLNFDINTPNHFNGIDAELYTVVCSWTNGQHNFSIASGSSTLSSHNFNNYRVVKTTNTIPSNLVGTNTNVTFNSNLTTGSANRNNPSLIEIKYARTFDFSGLSEFVFEIDGNNAIQYIEISNLNDLGNQPYLYDVTNGIRLSSTDPAGSTIHRFALPPSNEPRKLVLRANSNSTLTTINAMEQIAFIDYSKVNNQGDYVLLTHKDFINSAAVDNYISHRTSFNGGGFDVVKVDIEQLYNQFAYGIDKHPQSIRSFIEYIDDVWTANELNLFIVGKGREYKDFRFNNTIRENCLIPTFGNPGSDILLAADTISSVPKVSIGRLAATNTNQIDDYLQKIIQYDDAYTLVGDPNQTIAQKNYMKQIVHLGGGTNISQQTQFRNYLTNYENTAKGTSWGTKTLSVYKNSSAPIQTLASERIRNRINDGVSMICFFGHSYAGGFDISFDDPENYTNQGKYPIFIANGCNSGLIHAGSQSISERFVFADQKGAIAYLSTTDLSASGSLNIYTSNFYLNACQSDYQKSLGEIVQQTIADVEACCSVVPIDMMVAQEMTLHGDPAIPFNHYGEPDYAIEAQEVYFSPNQVSTSLDSFEIFLNIYNLGKAINDSFNVELTRLFPNGNQEVFTQRVAGTYHNDTVSFKLATNTDNSGLGLNRFNIVIDVDDEIQNELSETNNYLLNTVELFIGSDEIFPIWPYEFAIVPQQNQTLKASTGNPLEPLKNYVFQIDTSELFLQPLASTTISSIGGVIEWTAPITFTDSTVYYWRVSPDSTSISSYKWKYSSFIYLANEYPGWNQSHYYQWLKDDYQNVYLDTDREFKFIDIPKEIYVKAGQYPNIFYEEMEWKMDGAQMHNWKMNNCGGGVGFPNGLSIAVIDNVTGLPLEIINNGSSSYGPFGNIHCVGVENIITVANFRAFGNTPSNHPTPGIPWSDLIIDYLNNVPQDYYVLIYSINNPKYEFWDNNLVSYFNNLTCPIDTSTSGPMIFAYQKNNTTFTPIVNIGSSFSTPITSIFSISGTWNSGNISSTLIGPATEWGSFHWKHHASEVNSDDEVEVEIYGSNGSVNTLLYTVPSSVNDTIIQSISATTYPYLQLKLKTSDVTDRTPSQLDYWRILYKKAPEAAINPAKYLSINKDTLQEGEKWTVAMAVENVSDIDMDSLSTKFQLTNNNNMNQTQFVNDDSLFAFDTMHIHFEQETLNGNFRNNNSFSVEINPYEYKHQLEQFHFNNYADLNFFVQKDNINPLLDVSFDGIKILDGDLVSAKPEIVIQLKDNSQYLALDDTSLIDIYFRYLGVDGNTPGALIPHYYNDGMTQFVPANLATKNEAKVVLQKEFIEDGFYELVIRSSDKSGNHSSSSEDRLTELVYYDYKISFQVDNQSSISNLINYPNPFTTRTQFIFTLTGSEIPDYFEIQIMNIKGTVVKQITQDEFGPIHIGLNKSEYWWDGTDEYGDALANGVYFYKVISTINNESIDHYSINNVDKFFKKGVGKMVLIR